MKWMKMESEIHETSIKYWKVNYNKYIFIIKSSTTNPSISSILIKVDRLDGLLISYARLNAVESHMTFPPGNDLIFQIKASFSGA